MTQSPTAGSPRHPEPWPIRDAGPDDLAALRLVYRRAALSNEGDRPLFERHPEYLVLSEEEVTQGRTRAALDRERIVGFAIVRAEANHLELDALFTDPDWMRRGIGMALVVDAVAHARTLGTVAIEVTGNDHAAAFYAAAGFTPMGIVDTPGGVPATRYRLSVTEPHQR